MNKLLKLKEVIAIVNKILQGKDTKPSAWAEKSIAWAVKNKVSDGSRPKGYATREEVIVMLDNLND